MISGTLDQKTYWPKTSAVTRKWFLLNAKDQVLGRLSSRIAGLLMGKGKTLYTPSVDCGDFVVAINVGKIRFTGKKLEKKTLFHHTGYPGGKRLESYKKLFQERPGRILQLAVKRMLPKNKLASRQILRLKIYSGESHPHQCQNPMVLNGN